MKLLNRKKLFFLFFLMTITFLSFERVSALSYQEDIGVNFTFNSALIVTLSSSDIHIDNLAPGTSSDSNIINVNVLTNSPYGYTLTASVGNNTTYNTDNLIHSNSGISNVFSNTAFSTTPTITDHADLANNTWAFSFSTNNGSSWSNYNGLPLYSDTTNIATLKQSNAPVATNTGDDIKFKIGAKASSDQVAGTYRNVINFNIVAAPSPVTIAMSLQSASATQVNGYYAMQDMTSSVCAAIEVDDDQLQVIDTRDNKVYWIAKLQDGKCWMTQNLDLDLDSSRTYTHADTDLGWGSDSATTSWTPARSTITANASGSFDGWVSDENHPYSVDPGTWYAATYNGASPLPFNEIDYLTSANRVTASGITTVYDDANHTNAYFKTIPFDSNGTHGHVGNYYNWSAAVASNDTSAFTSNTFADISGNPQNSICPAGWRLPTITSATPTYSSDGSANEYTRLAYLYGGYSGSSSLSSDEMESFPLYFVRTGAINSGSIRFSGEYGYYSSSTVRADLNMYRAIVGNSSFNTSVYARTNGLTIRCVAR